MSALASKLPAVRLAEPFHRVLSILAARRGVKIKVQLEEILAMAPSMLEQAAAEQIDLAKELEASR